MVAPKGRSPWRCGATDTCTALAKSDRDICYVASRRNAGDDVDCIFGRAKINKSVFYGLPAAQRQCSVFSRRFDEYLRDIIGAGIAPKGFKLAIGFWRQIRFLPDRKSRLPQLAQAAAAPAALSGEQGEARAPIRAQRNIKPKPCAISLEMACANTVVKTVGMKSKPAWPCDLKARPCTQAKLVSDNRPTGEWTDYPAFQNPKARQVLSAVRSKPLMAVTC